MDMSGSDRSRRRRMDKQLFLARQCTKLQSNATWDNPMSKPKESVVISGLGYNSEEESPKFITFRRTRSGANLRRSTMGH